ncbi:hypothetical protein ACFE04_022413 [Oxalis oulophora]
MEDNDKKFVCKYCNKKYPCGKSLGGHIRTHMSRKRIANKIVEVELEEEEEEEEDEDEDEVEFINRDRVVAINGQSSYGLRENPKKTKRFVDSNRYNISKQEMLMCKECGKGFVSLKALCGHMASHSEKDSSEKYPKLVMDSQSDTESSSPSRRSTRSKMMKNYDSSSTFNGNYSSVIDAEHEQEDVAMCLMMLSRDSWYTKAWSSVADSSDNNSVVLETKSSSINMRITSKNNEDMVKKKFGEIKLKSAEVELSENSDSGYFNNGPKLSNESVDKFYETNSEYRSGFEEFADAELVKKSNSFKFKNSRAAAAKIQAYTQEFVDKTNGYKCLTCNKIFHSHRSLWGHQASHSRIINGCYNESTYESGENNIENDHNNNSIDVGNKNKNKNKSPVELHQSKRLGSTSKRNKGHQCPICFRMFKSGQALGGHKRSHFLGGGDHSYNGSTVVINNQSLSNMPDLNLPAPDDEEAIRFTPW